MGASRLRVLVTIPHAFLDLPGSARYGSEEGNAAVRAAALVRCVSALWQAFGPGHRLIGPTDPACNAAHAALAVVVCSAGEQHLADALPPGLAHHHRTDLHPRELGFACHQLLRANLGLFDWFGYLEDDLELTDALWFDKLAWFNAAFGPDAMLLPNRFEVSTGPVPKLFIDGAMDDPAAAAAFQDVAVRPRLEAPWLGRSLAFRRVANPHAGCFFADAAQMAVLAAHPEFGRFSTAFRGPLESAATLPPLRSFAVYKPARANASFLELRHLDQRHLDRRVRYERTPGGLRKIVTEDP